MSQWTRQTQFVTSSGQTLSGTLSLCIYLVKNHNESRHEEDFVGLAELCARFGIAEYIAPVPIPPTPEEQEQLEALRITALRKEAIGAIADAADRYVNHEANADLKIELKALSQLPEPNLMVVAIRDWGKAIFREAEIRKSQVDAGLCDDGDYSVMLDFTMFGEKPHTVAELWMAGLIQL